MIAAITAEKFRNSEQMPQIRFFAERCKGCGLCVLVCPQRIIAMSEELNELGNPFAGLTEPARCTYCAACGRMCPDLAIEIEDGSPSADNSTSSE